MWRRTARWLAYAAVGLATAFFLQALFHNFGDIPPIQWSAKAISTGLLSVAGVTITIGLIGLMWHLLLLDQGLPVAIAKSLQIIAVAQIGKYLPGNVGHFAGRTALGSAAGIPAGVVLSTILIETIWTVAVGTGLSVLAAILYVDLRQFTGLPNFGHWHLVLLGFALFLLPSLGVLCINRWMPKLSRWIGGGKPIVVPRLSTAIIVVALMLTCFLLLGAILQLQAQWLFEVQNTSLLQLTCLFTAAWLAGYLIPGAPGGLGVREAMMVLLLGPVLGAGVAAGLGVTMRLATVLGDGVGFAIGMVSKRFV